MAALSTYIRLTMSFCVALERLQKVAFHILFVSSFSRSPSNRVLFEDKDFCPSLASMQSGPQKQGWEFGRDSVNGADIESGATISATPDGKHIINSLC